MIKYSTIATLLALCIEHASLANQPLRQATEDHSSTAQSRCSDQPSGRVLTQGDRHFKALDFVCQGDRLDVKKGSVVVVECFALGENLEFNGSSLNIESRCPPSSRPELPEFCAARSRENCSGTNKGPSNENTPVRITPYNNLLFDGRPFLSWHPVLGATSYVVEIHGKDVNWQKTVTGTASAYPTEEVAMQPGNAYKITIIAVNGSSSISSTSESSVNLLPLSEAKQVMKMTQLLNSLSIPNDEKAVFDLDSIYMSRGLLTATIATLEARVKAGSQSPVVHRKLGDRYLEAGLSDRAESEYKSASNLAKKNNDSVELAKAKAGLKLIAKYRFDSGKWTNQSQLPTKINGAQK